MHAATFPSRIRFAGREHAISELDDIDQLVRLHRGHLLRFITYTTGDQDLAESIVQDCFLKAYRARDTFRGDCSARSWLTGIALNLVRDQERTLKFRFWRKARQQALDVTELASTLATGGSSPEAQLLAHERAQEVAAALKELSPNQRTVFLLRFQEEMDLSEISATMGMPVNTVKTHLHRAVKSIRESLGGSR